jgi:hypothetical protein
MENISYESCPILSILKYLCFSMIKQKIFTSHLSSITAVSHKNFLCPNGLQELWAIRGDQANDFCIYSDFSDEWLKMPSCELHYLLHVFMLESRSDVSGCAALMTLSIMVWMWSIPQKAHVLEGWTQAGGCNIERWLDHWELWLHQWIQPFMNS